MRHRTALIARGCRITIWLVFVVLPTAGFAFALWVVLTPTAEETAAATAYRKNAPACSSVLSTEQGCIRSKRAEIVNYSWSVGRCGSHTDRFTLKLNDGLHTAEVGFDCLAANASHGWSDGRVNVREYRGGVTQVVGPSTTSITFTELDSLSAYTFTVVAINAVGSSQPVSMTLPGED